MDSSRPSAPLNVSGPPPARSPSPSRYIRSAAPSRSSYWPLRNDNRNYPKPSPSLPSPADVEAAQGESVRLWSLGDKAFARLANHGYSLCDSAMRSFVLDAEPPAPVLPY